MDGLTIGERLEDLIIENGKTLQAVSDEIKDKYGFTIAKSTLSKTINNKSIPQGETIIYLSKYFNVSADYLLGLTDIKTTDIDFKAVCDYTGLNEKAINKLSLYGSRIEHTDRGEYNDRQRRKHVIESDIISSGLLTRIANNVISYNEKSEQLLSLFDSFKQSNNNSFGELEDIINKQKEMKYKLYEMQEDCIEYIKKQCPNTDILNKISEKLYEDLTQDIIEDTENGK